MATNQDKNTESSTQGTSYLYEYGTSPNTRAVVSQKIRLLAPAYGSTVRSQLGVVSSFGPSQSRNVEAIKSVGYGDKIAELVPGTMDPIAGDLERAMLYLCNLWQSFGYAAGVDGPVRTLAHHRWPFDIEVQLVFSTLADNDLGVANVGANGSSAFQAGQKQISFANQGTTAGPTPQGQQPTANTGHTALITLYEACWFTSYNNQIAKDTVIMMESGGVTATDVHDLATVYGEFIATGNDPTLGQYGSERYKTA